MDADHSHQPSEIPNMLEKIKNFDYLIASRHVEGSDIVGWGIGRKATHSVAGAIAKACAKIEINDSTSGFRMFKKKTLERIDFEISILGTVFSRLPYGVTYKAYHYGTARYAESAVLHRTINQYQNIEIFDKLFNLQKNVKTVKRFRYLKEVYHLYHINVKKRDQLQQYLIKNGVDAKVHYPIPIHLQPAAKYLKYKRGDFPIAEKMANTTMSLPVHEFIKEKDIKYVANLINKFYSKKTNL